MVNNFVTFDIAEWYHANYEGVDFSHFEKNNTNLENNVDILLNICEKHNVKSTCFILGEVGKSHPNLIRKIYNQGHEIASHGNAHKLVYQMTEKEFKNDLKISKDILENIIGDKVNGFRAPSWSINNDVIAWYYNILEDLGFNYSSSVYPAHTFLYGIKNFPAEAHYPIINSKRINILEIPVPVTNILGKKIGFSGGFYFRLFPLWFIKFILNKNKNKNYFLYLHPREIDIFQPKLKLNLLNSFIHYWNIKGCQKKLNKIIMTNFRNSLTIHDYFFKQNL